MPSASGTLREGISLINVFVSVTTQWTDLAPTFPDTQPEKSSEGSEALALPLGLVPYTAELPGVLFTVIPCIPVTLMILFHTLPPPSEHEGSSVPVNSSNLGQLSGSAFWKEKSDWFR